MPRETVQKLKPSRMHAGESRIRWWYANPEEGTSYQTLFDPVYWDTVGYQLEIGDFIQVVPDELNYIAWLHVISKGIGGVTIIEFYKKNIEEVESAGISLHDYYRIKYAGPHHKWRVERKTDGHVERHGFTNENDANKWLALNAAALSSRAKPKAA